MNNISFNQLYKDYKDKLMTTISKRIKDKDEVEDIVQEVFIKVHENLDKYDPAYSISTWIYTIAINTVTNYNRAKARHLRVALSQELYDNEHTESFDSPENILIAQQTKTLADSAIKSLREDLYQAFQLKDVDDLSYKEVADALGVPENTAKSRVRRAREHIQKEME